MNKAILILSILFFQISTASHAQYIEKNMQTRQYVELKTIEALEDGRWIMGGNSFMWSPPNEHVWENFTSMVDTSRTFQSIGSTGVNVEKININGIRGFGFIKAGSLSHLFRISVNANSMSSFNKHQIEDDEEVYNFKTFPNGSLIVVGTKIVDGEQRAHLSIFRNGFIEDFTDYSELGYYSDIIINDDNSFLITGSFGTTSLFGGRKYNQYFEQQGDVLEGVESDRIFFIENNGYLLLKDHVVSKFDDDFQIEMAADFESYGEIIDMEVDDTNAFLLYQKEGEAPMILRINHALEIENTFHVEDEYFIANDIELSENEIGIGGYLIPNLPFNGTPYLYPSTSGFFKTFSKNGITEEGEFDLGILGVSVEDYEKNPNCGTESYDLNLKNLKVVLVNNGTKTIDKAVLFVKAKGVESCNSETISTEGHIQRDELTLLHLEPGDTINYRISNFEFTKNITDTTTVELCVWHSSVDGQRDINEENNYYCDEVELKKGYAEIPIREPTDGEFLIYPNPIKEVMNVSLLRPPFEPTLIEFYDYPGREIELKYFIAPRAKFKEFDISQMPSGFYFMKISNDLFEDMIKVYVN